MPGGITILVGKGKEGWIASALRSDGYQILWTGYGYDHMPPVRTSPTGPKHANYGSGLKLINTHQLTHQLIIQFVIILIIKCSRVVVSLFNSLPLLRQLITCTFKIRISCLAQLPRTSAVIY